MSGETIIGEVDKKHCLLWVQQGDGIDVTYRNPKQLDRVVSIAAMMPQLILMRARANSWDEKAKAIIADYLCSRLEESSTRSRDLAVRFRKLEIAARVLRIIKSLAQSVNPIVQAGLERNLWACCVADAKQDWGALYNKLKKIDRILLSQFGRCNKQKSWALGMQITGGGYDGVFYSCDSERSQASLGYLSKTSALFGSDYAYHEEIFESPRSLEDVANSGTEDAEAKDRARALVAAYLIAVTQKGALWRGGNFRKRFDDICFAYRLLGKLSDHGQFSRMQAYELDSRIGTIAKTLAEVKSILAPKC